MPYLIFLVCWIAYGFWQIGYDSPDEHFPTLEAASRLAFGHGLATWEFEKGLRSWAQPWLLSLPLRAGAALGIENRLWLDGLARACVSATWLAAVWAVGDLARSLYRADARTVARARLWLAFAWPCVAWGTRHGSDTFGVPALLAGFALLARAASPLRGPAAPAPRAGGFLFAAGACLGLAFELRYTLGVPIALGALLMPRLGARRIAAAAAVALAVAGALEGLNGWVYSRLIGSWAVPAWEFFRYNVVQGSPAFQRSPWWELVLYLALLWVPFGGWVPAIRAAARELGAGRWRSPASWAALTALGTLAVLASVRHGELRFVLPLVPLGVLASVPWLAAAGRPRWLAAAAGINALMIAFAAVFYADPHGTVVRGLDAASAAASSPATPLVNVGYTSFLPLFYLRKPLPAVGADSAALREFCEGRWPGGPAEVAGASEAVILSSELCPGAVAPGCREVLRLEPGWGTRLRARISTIAGPRVVYLCRR